MTDDEVVAAVSEGVNTNAALRARFFPGETSYVRALDEALQRLRRAGRINVTGRTWTPADVKVCPTCNGSGRVVAKKLATWSDERELGELERRMALRDAREGRG